MTACSLSALNTLTTASRPITSHRHQRTDPQSPVRARELALEVGAIDGHGACVHLFSIPETCRVHGLVTGGDFATGTLLS